MENIFNGITPTAIAGQTTTFISALSPIVTFLVGILLAFFIIKSIINMITGNKNNLLEKENNNIDDNDDFPY